MRNTNPIPCQENDSITGWYDPTNDYVLNRFPCPLTKEQYDDWYCSRQWEKRFDKNGKAILPSNNWDKIFHKEDSAFTNELNKAMRNYE